MERARFVTTEHERSRNELKQFGFYAVVFAFLGAVVMGLATQMITGALLGFLVLGGVGVLVVISSALWGGTRERADAGNLNDIYLGDLGIYHAGRYTPVRGLNLFLIRVEFQRGTPSVLEFTIGSRTQHGVTRQSEVRVLVPAGREAEAQPVEQRYHREFGLSIT